jgi:hypothetical protein
VRRSSDRVRRFEPDIAEQSIAFLFGTKDPEFIEDEDK